jgi:hypothetical protein
MRVSVIVCSIDEARLAAVTAHYRERLAGTPHEILAIRDARSLAGAWNRAAADAKGELLVFSHDDVEHLRPDFAAVLLSALERFDIVGAAGASRCVDAYWPAAGHPHLHGGCAGPAPQGGVTMKLYGVEGESAGAIEALDGMFIAARREAWARSPFDEATFDGFHGYDVDFAFSAAKLGLRVGVDNRFLVLHQSPGRFDERWRHYRERFLAKHFPGRPVEPPRRPPLVVLPFASAGDLAAQWDLGVAQSLTRQFRSRVVT